MKHRTVNDYFKQQWPRLILFAAFTLGVSFFAPLKNFQLKWLIDSKSKQEALGYMGLVFAITFSSWFFERLSRRSFTKIACGAVEQVRQRILEQVLHRTVAQYNAEGDAAYLSLLTTDLRTLYDDYYMSLFNIVFWGGIMLCALAMYLYISPVMLLAILLVTIPPLVLPRRMNEWPITPSSSKSFWAGLRSSAAFCGRTPMPLSTRKPPARPGRVSWTTSRA